MNEENKTPVEEAEQALQQEQEAPAPMEAPDPGIGDMMKEGARKAVAALVVFLLIVAYLGGLAYAEVHGLNMLRSGVAPDLLMWAYVGMVSLGVLAIALPLALHFYSFDPLQRLVTFIFYGVDLALLGINSFTDYGSNTGAQLTQWAQFYKDYIMPSTPVIAGVMATVLLLLDPHVKALVLRQTLRATMLQKQANLVIKAANNPSVTATVDAAARQEVDRALTDLFGYKVTPAKGYVMHMDQPTRGGLAARFFDWLSERATQALSFATRGQSQPSASKNEAPQDEPKP